MRRFIGSMILIITNILPALAQTQPATTLAPLVTQPATLSEQAAIDLTATQILAQYTATAEAFPVPIEQVDEFGFFAFTLAMGSMLIVLIPVGYGFWRMNRGKQ
jgi:hypothetical protein